MGWSDQERHGSGEAEVKDWLPSKKTDARSATAFALERPLLVIALERPLLVPLQKNLSLQPISKCRSTSVPTEVRRAALEAGKRRPSIPSHPSDMTLTLSTVLQVG